MTDTTTDRAGRLDDLRGALLAAAAADLAGADAARSPELSSRPAARPASRLRLRPARVRLVLALLLLFLALPGLVIGTGLVGPDRAAANGLPTGTKLVTDTQPTCTALREGVEYDCSFASSPQVGRTVRTVDAGGRVNGGCRTLNVVETLWICYLGKAAVRHGLVAPAAL